MNQPQPGDFIDIHTHGTTRSNGVFAVQNLMAHEDIIPSAIESVSFSFGIHPWFLAENNFAKQIRLVEEASAIDSVIAIGEAGFDKIKGPSADLQRKAFEEQVMISEIRKKPLFIHCVRGWDELLSVHKMLKPKMAWMVHGYRGNNELAAQLISKGMYLSFWYDFVLGTRSAGLLRYVPPDRIFLETDGADVDIRDIYMKVSVDLNISAEELKSLILLNYITFFNIKSDRLRGNDNNLGINE
jgi:TatD DNase family protein